MKFIFITQTVHNFLELNRFKPGRIKPRLPLIDGQREADSESERARARESIVHHALSVFQFDALQQIKLNDSHSERAGSLQAPGIRVAAPLLRPCPPVTVTVTGGSVTPTAAARRHLRLRWRRDAAASGLALSLSLSSPSLIDDACVCVRECAPPVCE